MGADGGLNWMRLRDPEKRQHAIDLISPLGLIDHNWRDEDYAWYKQHGDKLKNCIVSKYGTDRDQSGMEDLKDILDYPFSDIDFSDYTFAEMVEELATRPEYQMYGLSTLEKAILSSCAWWSYPYCSTYYSSIYFGESRFKDDDLVKKRLTLTSGKLGILREIKIGDWLKEVEQLVIKDSVSSVETWT